MPLHIIAFSSQKRVFCTDLFRIENAKQVLLLCAGCRVFPLGLVFPLGFVMPCYAHRQVASVVCYAVLCHGRV